MASVYDIELDQGSDAVIPFEMYDANDTPLDLSGYTARMQILKAGKYTLTHFPAFKG